MVHKNAPFSGALLALPGSGPCAGGSGINPTHEALLADTADAAVSANFFEDAYATDEYSRRRVA